MWWVMMREPAAVQRHDSEPAEQACKQKKVPSNSLTVLTHRQDTNTQIAQDRKEDSNTLITCRTRSQRVKDKRGSHKCSQIPVENFNTWSQVWSSQAAAAQASTQRGMLT